MSKNANTQLAHSFTTMTANMQRLSESEVLTVIGTLKELETELASELADNPKLTAWTKRKYEALISQNKKTVAEYYKSINTQHHAFLTGVGGVTQAGVSNAFSGIHVPLPSVALTSDQLKSLASNALIQGAPSNAWWAKQSQNLQDAFAQQMRIGYAGGETVEQLIQRVRGTATGRKNAYFVNGAKKIFNEFEGGIMDTGTRQAAALVRTSVQQMSNDAKMFMFKKNAALIKGVMWLATLDTRTTLLCVQRDGKLYTLEGEPIKHKLPFLGGTPAHFNCRSTLVPVTRSWEELGANPGTDKKWFEALDPGLRSSLDGYVADTVTFESWFAGLAEVDQIAYLGPRKFEIYQKAGLSVADMADQFGNPLTLEQLADAYGYRIDEFVRTGIQSSPIIQQSAIGLQREIDIRASEIALEQIELAQTQATKEAQEKLSALIEDDPYAKKHMENLKKADAWTDDPQKNFAALDALAKEEAAMAAQISELELSINSAVKDVNESSAVHFKAQVEKMAFNAVKQEAAGILPTEFLPAYKTKLAALEEANTVAYQILKAKTDDPLTKPLWKSFIKTEVKTPWDVVKTADDFAAYIAKSDIAAAKEIEAVFDPISKKALTQAQAKIPQGQAGSITATVQEMKNIGPDILKKEQLIAKAIDDFPNQGPLQKAVFQQVDAQYGATWKNTMTPSEFEKILQSASAVIEKQAAEEAAQLIGSNFTLQEFLLNKNIVSTNFSSMYEYNAAVKAAQIEMQANAAKLAAQAVKDVAGAADLVDGSIVQLGKKKFDLSIPEDFAAFKKAKSQGLSLYKKAILEGKQPTKGALQAYEILGAEEKAAFNAKLQLAAEKAKPITMNATPEPGILQMDQLEYIKPKTGGSLPGAWYRDPVSGIEYLVKHPLSDDIARNEVLTSKLYQAAGVGAPDLTLVANEGRLSIASRGVVIEEVGAQQLARAIGMHDNFAVDAWLANWDVVGMSFDNTVLLPNGTAFRIDVGGGLRYRAQGGLKGASFGKEVMELESLRSRSVNYQAYEVFKDIKQVDIEAGVKKVLALDDTTIRGLVKKYGPIETAEAEALADLLIARKEYLAKQFPHLVEAIPTALPVGGTKTINSTVMRSIENGRINGYAISVDKKLVEDQSALLWFEKDVAGNDVAGLKLKFTDEARDIIKSKITIVGGADIELPYEVEQAYASFKVFLRRQWNVHHNQLGKAIDEVLAKQNVAELNDKFLHAMQTIRSYDLKSSAHFQRTFAPIVQDIEKSYAQKVFKPLGTIAENKFLESPLSAYKLQQKQIEETLKAAGTEFREVIGQFYVKELNNGFATQTSKPLVGKEMHAGAWSRVLEATTDDGTRIRLWFDESHGGYAIRNTLEVLTPGKTMKDVSRLLSTVENELGVSLSAPSLLEQEEMYLRMIARASNKWKFLEKADLPSFASEKTVEQRVKQWRKWLSKEFEVDNITKVEGYNPFGVHEAFDTGRRRWYMPGADSDPEWRKFFDDHSLFHSLSPQSSDHFIEIMDSVLRGGGTLTNTVDKLRKGTPWFGMSPGSDMGSGGAEYFFTRLFANNNYKLHTGGSLVWDSKHVTRLDSISYANDLFGRTTGNTIKKNKVSGIQNLIKVADNSSNETLFKHGMSIFDGLKYINAGTEWEAKSLLELFAKHGWTDTWIDGRKMNEIIHLHGKPYYP